jgi:hypothetical protein
MMKRFASLLALTLILSGGAWAQNLVKGTVFDDANGNSRFDTGEKGVPNVGVSNGSDVVRTDAEGRYSLPASEPMTVFVIRPAGYRVPVNAMQLPQFYYLHRPDGSPATTYPGSAPTGPLPESVNFPLLRADDPENFNILVFGDTQPYSETDIDYLRRTVQNLSGIEDMAFGVTLGDITGDRPDFFAPVSSAIAGIGLPWHHLPGNHDHNYDTDDDRLATESFEAFYGPATYSFNHGRVHFIVIDDIIHRREDEGGRQQARYTGGLREDQFRFIENDLKFVPKDHLIVLMMHIQLFNEAGGETFRRADRDRLFAALAPFDRSISLSAHTHYIRQDFFGPDEGFHGRSPHFHLNAGAICGDWWRGVVDQYELPGAMMRDGAPQGYFVLKFTGNDYICDYHTVHYRDPQQISLYKQDDTLYANFFTGNRFSTLRYRVDGGAWQPMTLTDGEHDPLFTAIRRRWDEAPGLPGKTPSRPAVCTHLWKAPIAVGRRDSVVEVEATDHFGRTFAGRMIVE